MSDTDNNGAQQLQNLNSIIEELQKPIKQIVKNYFLCEGDRDVSLSGMLNWFAIKPRQGGESAFEESKSSGIGKDHLLERKKHVEVLSSGLEPKEPRSSGRAHDLMILSVSNDIIAQLEAAANFRRMKVSHHFAKSKYNIRQLGEGAKEPKKEDSILEEYTVTFINNAIEKTK